MSWLNTWAKRIKLTVSGTEITEDLTDFPILITLASGTGINDADITSIFDELTTVTGTKKIAVTAMVSDVETQCYTEIERWDWSNEQAWLWTKVPTLASGVDTDLYLYYDSTKDDNIDYIGDTGDTPAQNVWDDNFKLVCHMAQDPSGGVGCILDSTVNVNNGTPGSMVSNDLVDGKIGKALTFDGVSTTINFGSPASLDFGKDECTLFCLLKTSVGSGADRIISNGWYGYCKGICFKASGEYAIGATDSNSAHDAVIDVANFADSVWHGITFTYDYDHYLKGYYDDGLDTTLDISGYTYLSADHSYNLHMGSHNGTLEFYNGLLCEVQLSNTVRSAAWIKATYYSNWDSLITFGTEEDLPIYCFSGYVYEQGSPASRILYLHYRDDGSLIDTTTASGNGYYYLETTYSGSHYIVCLDDESGEDYNDLIIGNVYPEEVV